MVNLFKYETNFISAFNKRVTLGENTQRGMDARLVYSFVTTAGASGQVGKPVELTIDGPTKDNVTVRQGSTSFKSTAIKSPPDSNVDIILPPLRTLGISYDRIMNPASAIAIKQQRRVDTSGTLDNQEFTPPQPGAPAEIPFASIFKKIDLGQILSTDLKTSGNAAMSAIRIAEQIQFSVLVSDAKTHGEITIDGDNIFSIIPPDDTQLVALKDEFRKYFKLIIGTVAKLHGTAKTTDMNPQVLRRLTTLIEKSYILTANSINAINKQARPKIEKFVEALGRLEPVSPESPGAKIEDLDLVIEGFMQVQNAMIRIDENAGSIPRSLAADVASIISVLYQFIDVHKIDPPNTHIKKLNEKFYYRKSNRINESIDQQINMLTVFFDYITVMAVLNACFRALSGKDILTSIMLNEIKKLNSVFADQSSQKPFLDTTKEKPDYHDAFVNTQLTGLKDISPAGSLPGDELQLYESILDDIINEVPPKKIRVTRKQLRQLMKEALNPILKDMLMGDDMDYVTQAIEILRPQLEEALAERPNDRRKVYRLTIDVLRLYHSNKQKIRKAQARIQRLKEDIKNNRITQHNYDEKHGKDWMGYPSQAYRRRGGPYDEYFEEAERNYYGNIASLEEEIKTLEEKELILKDYLLLTKKYHRFREH